MNENKTAITKMVNWLEGQFERDRINATYKNAIQDCLLTARALESSQAERDKGLVEELKKEIRSRSYSYENDECNTQVIPVGDLLKILSRHEKGGE